MQKRIKLAWLATLALVMSASVAVAQQDSATLNYVIDTPTNIAVTPTPVQLDTAHGGANVRVLYHSGTNVAAGVVYVLPINVTTVSALVTNYLLNVKGVIPLYPGSNIVFRRGGLYDLWRGPLYGVSATAATNAISVLNMRYQQ